MGLGNVEELDLIFGPESKGSTSQERARSSSRIFVRSQVQLAEDTPQATGRRLSAWEALQSFGMRKLREVFEYGSAILPRTAEEPARTLRARRDDLGLSVTNISSITGLSEDDVEDAENPTTLTSIHTIEKIAQALALDEHAISYVPQAGGDPDLAARLKALGSTQFTPSVVSRLCEAAWVSKKQYELYRWLYSKAPASLINLGFEPSPNYGDSTYPAWMHGYFLARQARELLEILADEPIESLRELIEERLELPLIQLGLPDTVAGATVANGSARGIAVNVQGANENVWIRRMTLAHELGHLLWDPDEKLKSLEVDNYTDLDEAPWGGNYIEQRANAFAVEFLAPQEAAVKVFKSRSDYSSGLRLVMETFGLSYTSAKYHIWNGCERQMSLDGLMVGDCEPTDQWIGREDFARDFFKPESVPISRRGRFACLVVQATHANLLTEESAASYLRCSVDDYKSNIDVIRSICGME